MKDWRDPIDRDPQRKWFALAIEFPRRRFFQSEIEQMGYYRRGSDKPPYRSGYYLSVDRVGDMIVLLYDPANTFLNRFKAAWRPYRVNTGLWFWG